MIQKKGKFFKRKIVKITKWPHASKDYASSYNVEILNSFNIELEIKDTESAIKSKLTNLLAQWIGFKIRDNTSFSV